MIGCLFGDNNQPIGLGLKIPTPTDSYTYILLPMNTGAGLLIEPMFGLNSYDYTNIDEEGISILIGVGLFYKKHFKYHNIYFGVRWNQYSESIEIDGTDVYEDDEGYINTVGYGLGIESPINPSLSISGEIFYNTLTLHSPNELTTKSLTPQLILRFYMPN